MQPNKQRNEGLFLGDCRLHFHCCYKVFRPVNTSVAPDLMIIKVCVARHFIHAGKEGMGQGAAQPVKRVPVVMKQAGKRHFDVPAFICQSMESQGGHVAPSFEGMTQDSVHQIFWQAWREGG